MSADWSEVIHTSRSFGCQIHSLIPLTHGVDVKKNGVSAFSVESVLKYRPCLVNTVYWHTLKKIVYVETVQINTDSHRQEVVRQRQFGIAAARRQRSKTQE